VNLPNVEPKKLGRVQKALSVSMLTQHVLRMIIILWKNSVKISPGGKFLEQEFLPTD